VINAASETWPEVKVSGISVPSQIKEQPTSDEETRQGASNRAKAVLEKGLKTLDKNLENDQVLGVGLEGGIFIDEQNEMWSTVWIAVIDQQGNLFEANGARFKVDPIVAEPIKKGEEMGPVIAQIVGEADVRSKQGMIGIVTANFVDRTEEYSGIVKMALGLWYRPQLENKTLKIYFRFLERANFNAASVFPMALR
jgi:inosine/xanthosine triphosphatase